MAVVAVAVGVVVAVVIVAADSCRVAAVIVLAAVKVK